MQLALVHKKGPSKDELNVKRYGYIFSLWSDCFYFSCTKLTSHRIATRYAYPYICSLAVNLVHEPSRVLLISLRAALVLRQTKTVLWVLPLEV